MIPTFLTGFLTSALLLSSTVSIQPTVSPVALTQVLPVDQVIAHTTHDGETLETIARDRYGDESYWKTLWNDNAWITDPNDIAAGSRVTLQSIKPEQPDMDIVALQKESETVVVAIINPVIGESISFPTPSLVPPLAPTSAVAVVAAPTSFDDVYKQAGEKYGVPWQVLYGLHITETGGRNGAIMNGSGSGARGPMQFMPGTWRAYGVDGNGDGIADIDNAVDAIHGAANYLAKHGSLQSGLRSYGGNTTKTLLLAQEKGFSE